MLVKPVSIEDIPALVRPLMRGFKALWCVAGGWALDLFLGQVTRPHDDLEFAIFRQDQHLLRQHLRDWTFQKVVEGRHLAWSADEGLKLPIHEIHAHLTKDPRLSFEFLLNERTADDWVYRREGRIRMPLERAIVRHVSGLPILCPAIVLLFKAKNHRPKDDRDFQKLRNALGREQWQWLEASLRICHPAHPWLAQLQTTNGAHQSARGKAYLRKRKRGRLSGVRVCGPRPGLPHTLPPSATPNGAADA